jgi:hypothetical protein
MNKEIWQWIVLACLAVGLIGVGVMIGSQNSQMAKMSRALTAVSSQVQDLSKNQNTVEQPLKNTATEPAAAPIGTMITQRTVTRNGASVMFAHRCKGEIKIGHILGSLDQPINYCIGENQLSVILGVNGTSLNEKILDTRIALTTADAPVLLASELVPNSKDGNVLVSYTPELCTTNRDECGPGMPNYFVAYVYNLSTQTLRSIAHYPQDGYPTWNPSGTKAVFIPNTCGGAGCGVEALTGYDLLTDTATSVTTVVAAGTESGGETADATGRKNSRWLSVTWKNDSDFSAKVQNVDKTETAVSGSF